MYASKALLDLEGIQVLQVDKEVNLRTLVSYYPYLTLGIFSAQ